MGAASTGLHCQWEASLSPLVHGAARRRQNRRVPTAAARGVSGVASDRDLCCSLRPCERLRVCASHALIGPGPTFAAEALAARVCQLRLREISRVAVIGCATQRERDGARALVRNHPLCISATQRDKADERRRSRRGCSPHKETRPRARVCESSSGTSRVRRADAESGECRPYTLRSVVARLREDVHAWGAATCRG
jgi:hypothetical protein